MSMWWCLRLRREAASVPLARRLLLDAMDSAGVDSEVSYELSIALSEACANAVEHGRGEHSDAYCVTTYLDGDRCRIEVADSGPGFRTAALSPSVPLDAENGRPRGTTHRPREGLERSGVERPVGVHDDRLLADPRSLQGAAVQRRHAEREEGVAVGQSGRRDDGRRDGERAARTHRLRRTGRRWRHQQRQQSDGERHEAKWPAHGPYLHLANARAAAGA